MSGDRLCLAALPRLAGAARSGEVALPRVPPASLRVGIVHLGIGAFHRAHQAEYTEDSMAAVGGDGWGICGVSQRTATVYDQLAPQDGLYTVLRRGGEGPAGRVVGAVREVMPPGVGAAVAARIADPAVRVVTLTVTEQGYRRGQGGGIDLTDLAVIADVAGFGRPGHQPATAIGQLVAGLRERWPTDAGLSVLSCDNLRGNGAVVRKLVNEFCAALPDRHTGDALAAWVAQRVSFPSSMVDRIVPATRTEDLAEVAELLGVRDAAAVTAEPFKQWVIEDDFAAGRPAWETAGALLTSDVTPYELAKLRLLNGTHSLLAYTGALAGYDTIAEAVGDPVLAAAAEHYQVADAIPTLAAPPGLDLDWYRRELLARFANPWLGHRTVQVAEDGSLKLPIRLVELVRQRRAAGAEPSGAALIFAAWVAYAAFGKDRYGRPLPLRDPLADRLRAAFAGCTTPSALIDAALAIREVFPADLAADAVFRDLLVEHAARLFAAR